MRVIVCGTREWPSFYWDELRRRVADILFELPPGSTIVHGNARGVDRIAHQEAEKLGHIPEPHPADWDKWGQNAGHIRNEKMAILGADLCIAIWDGRSGGTKSMIDKAKARGIHVREEVLACHLSHSPEQLQLSDD